MIQKDLVKATNSGYCVALIGSGPSCEVGVPSWEAMTVALFQQAADRLGKEESDRIKAQIAGRKYAEALAVIEGAMGRTEMLLATRRLVNSVRAQGSIYRMLARWPFAFYLTTNYDDLLHSHLQSEGWHFARIGNNPEMLKLIGVDTKDVVVKLHGDLTDDRTVVTSDDYDEVERSEAWAVYRDKLAKIFSMFTVLIIGHSLTDPDLRLILQEAKKTSSSLKPVYMFVADATTEQLCELHVKWNISACTYSNPDGQHKNLIRLLQSYDRFVIKRVPVHRPTGQLTMHPDPDSTKAARLHLFSSMSFGEARLEFLPRAYAAVVLEGLNVGDRVPMSVSDAMQQTSLGRSLHGCVDYSGDAMEAALRLLAEHAYISTTNEGLIRITELGAEKLATVEQQRRLLDEGFVGQVEVRLLKSEPKLSDERISALATLMKNCLTGIFARRGLELAQFLYRRATVTLEGNTAILDELNDQCRLLNDRDEQIAFVEVATSLLLEPTRVELEFLHAMPQGFFAYHVLGMDPLCRSIRLDAARRTAWFIDSSILIPLVAEGCSSHKAAIYIRDTCKNLALRLFTTEGLLDEVRGHAEWAIKFVEQHPPQSIEFKWAALGEVSYRQNLFIDGFINWSMEQGAPSFADYMRHVLGEGLLLDVRNRVKDLGIEVVESEVWGNLEPRLIDLQGDLYLSIMTIRDDRGTLRSDSQCLNEAAVMIIVKGIRERSIAAFVGFDNAYFVSQSGALNSVDPSSPNITFRPESFIRLLPMLGGEDNAYPLHETMLQDFFYAGVEVIDQSLYQKFFSPLINQSRMRLEEELKRYAERLEQDSISSLEDEIRMTPPLRIPDLAVQTLLRTADMELQKARATMREAAEAARAAKLSVSERQDYERLKAKQRDKHRKGLKQQRRAQSRPEKKRRKKK